MKYLNEFINELVRQRIPMLPTTEEEIEKIQKTLALSRGLPKAYVEFLSHLGRGTDGKFMPGEDWCINDVIDVIDLRDGLEELLIENESKLKLSGDDFVFWSAQGCAYLLFRLSEGDNPPVYFFDERDTDRFRKISNQFSQFLLDRAMKCKGLFKEIE